ncbi:GAF and ANTAR domain-containing protein [Amycolatopsis sp. NPDC054798]
MNRGGSSRLLALLEGTAPGMGPIERICELCVTELSVSGAGVSVMGTGRITGAQALVHATGPVGVRLEDLQLTLGEGPSVDAHNSGGSVLIPELALEHRRWPAFSPGAAGMGVAAVFSFPLQIGAARLGVLDLYRVTAGSLTPRQLPDALALAEAATVALLDDAEAPGGTSPQWLGDLHSQVHQATGIVSAQLEVSLREALLRIRGHAYAHQLSLNEVGKRIVDYELHLRKEE